MGEPLNAQLSTFNVQLSTLKTERGTKRTFNAQDGTENKEKADLGRSLNVQRATSSAQD